MPNVAVRQLPGQPEFVLDFPSSPPASMYDVPGDWAIAFRMRCGRELGHWPNSDLCWWLELAQSS